MKKTILVYIVIFLVLFTACNKKNLTVLTNDKLNYIKKQYENVLAESDDPTKIPRTTTNTGELLTSGINSWTSGFFAGNLWYMYELTGDEKWKNEATKWTEVLDSVQYYTNDHDIGFMINCSYGNGMRIAKKKEYEKVLMEAARSLSTRYDPVVKSIKSWNRKKSWDRKTIWNYPVIIDNMMNLELLFEASRISGDSSFAIIAINHALTTMKNHYRNDFSSYHVVNYDPLTGAVLDKATMQGFADESSWARGQAWGLYGFTVCYRYTKDERFLRFAESIADFIFNDPNLPENMIPYWDYNVNDPSLIPEWDYDATKFPEIPRDASAAAITSSALFELAKYSEDNGTKYLMNASKIIESLASPSYMSQSGDNKYFILNHSVGSMPHGSEIDVPLVYADYYFLEALIRKKAIISSTSY